jgi:hypothetical protein
MLHNMRHALSMAAVPLLLAAATSCGGDPPAHPALQAIDAVQARKLVLAKYRQLFADKFVQHGAEYVGFPSLDEAAFTSVVRKDHGWEVRCDPPVGYVVTARVSLAGDWVQLDEVSLGAL